MPFAPSSVLVRLIFCFTQTTIWTNGRLVSCICEDTKELRSQFTCVSRNSNSVCGQQRLSGHDATSEVPFTFLGGGHR